MRILTAILLIIFFIGYTPASIKSTVSMLHYNFEECGIISMEEFEFRLGDKIYLTTDKPWIIVQKTTIERTDTKEVTYCAKLTWI